MNNLQVNGWVILGLVIILAASYAFSFVNMKMLVPGAVAQIAGNQRLIGQINTAFQNQNRALEARLVEMERRLAIAEKK